VTSSKNTLCGLPMEAEGVVAPYVAWNTGLHMHGISWHMCRGARGAGRLAVRSVGLGVARWPWGRFCELQFFYDYSLESIKYCYWGLVLDQMRIIKFVLELGTRFLGTCDL